MKIYERIVEETGFPNENDLWIKEDNGNYSINIKKGNEWKPVASGGGGGSAEDAVSTNPQELTDTQKMQARANQGLYYSEAVPEQTISWDGTTTDRDWFGYKYQ